jgi:hypothetical protein
LVLLEVGPSTSASMLVDVANAPLVAPVTQAGIIIITHIYVCIH